MLERCDFDVDRFLQTPIGIQLRYIHSSPMHEKGAEDALRYVGRLAKKGENNVVSKHRVHSTFVKSAERAFPNIAQAEDPGTRLESLTGRSGDSLQADVLPLLKKGSASKCVLDHTAFKPHLRNVVPKAVAGAFPTCLHVEHSHQVGIEECLLQWASTGRLC